MHFKGEHTRRQKETHITPDVCQLNPFVPSFLVCKVAQTQRVDVKTGIQLNWSCKKHRWDDSLMYSKEKL